MQYILTSHLKRFPGSMEDNEYSFGATEDSSSRVSYSQGESEDNVQAGDSMMLDGGFSGKPILNPTDDSRHIQRAYKILNYLL